MTAHNTQFGDCGVIDRPYKPITQNFFYLKPSARSNRIRDMPRMRDSWVFALTLMSAAAVLVSIAGAETLLAAACLAWLIVRPRPFVLPSYIVPMCAFMATTVLALVMSPQPDLGMAAIRKFVLFTMGLLAANLVTTPARAKLSYQVLLAVAGLTEVYALLQFA